MLGRTAVSASQFINFDMTRRKALILGLAGTTLTADEHRLLREAAPAGIILFSRNCVTHEQIKTLVTEAKDAIGSAEVLVLIDQEGGRVQRLRPPLGRALPAAESYASLYAKQPEKAKARAYAIARLVADDLKALGINTNCAPVLDVPVDGADAIIGNRAYGSNPEIIIALAREVARGFMDGGVLPVIKHIPGHGRANKDSHLALPDVGTPVNVLETTDFLPFRELAGMPAAMTAHVVFSAIDAQRPASTSPFVIGEIVRGSIGFDGLLMSDDLSMKALEGPIRRRAEDVIAAGSDVALHCNGDFLEMVEAVDGVPDLDGKALERFNRAFAVTKSVQPFDVAWGEAELSSFALA